MIFANGYQLPTREQYVHARSMADDSFCVAASENFNKDGLPTFEDWKPACSTTLLKLANVEPHDDPWIGSSNHIDDPKVRRSIFWLMKIQSRKENKIDFYTDGKWLRMKAGQFVVFDDSKIHAVMADSKWIGAAWQLFR